MAVGKKHRSNRISPRICALRVDLSFDAAIKIHARSAGVMQDCWHLAVACGPRALDGWMHNNRCGYDLAICVTALSAKNPSLGRAMLSHEDHNCNDRLTTKGGTRASTNERTRIGEQ